MSPSRIEKTAKRWSEHTVEFGGRSAGLAWWEAGPAIQQHINERISGSSEVGWIQHTLKSYYHDRLPVSRMLSLGCGSGALERSLAELGAFESCDAYDVAEGSLNEARRLAEERGFSSISYAVADANKLVLPTLSYDAVWANASMHHFDALEHVCEQISAALKPGGLFVLNEYVGPSRFQFPDRQKEIADLCLQLLPERYRRLMPEQVARDAARGLRGKGLGWVIARAIDKLRDGDLLGVIQRRIQARRASKDGAAAEKVKVMFPSARDVAAVDPSEAVRSGDIVAVLERYFDIVERKDWGGNIIQFLLAGIAGNFTTDEASQGLVRMLMNIEDALIESGELSSDYAYIVARPKPVASSTE